MSQQVTQSHLKSAVREVIEHFNRSQGAQDDRLVKIEQRFDRMETRMDERFAQLDAKLDAIMEMLATRKELVNLVRELRGRGIDLDESKIFV